MDRSTHLSVGDIVQLDPETTRNQAFAGCLMTVSEPNPWGAQGYVQSLGESREAPGGQAYYLATWEEMEPTQGRAVWLAGSIAEE